MEEKKEKKRKPVEFLCCKCGIFIQSNKNNLKRHEQSHEKNVLKIKCAIENCVSTFVNKQNYYAHWQHKHNKIVMPDVLNRVIQPSKYSNKTKFKSSGVKQTFDNEQPTEFFVLNTLGLRHNFETKIKLPTLDSSFGMLE